jgi:hypothetical protein
VVIGCHLNDELSSENVAKAIPSPFAFGRFLAVNRLLKVNSWRNDAQARLDFVECARSGSAANHRFELHNVDAARNLNSRKEE